MEPTITDLLYESFWLLVIGMIVVFSFLTILIGAVKLIEKGCAAFPEQSPEQDTLPKPGFPNAGAGTPGANNRISPHVVAAITAAVHQHRKNN